MTDPNGETKDILFADTAMTNGPMCAVVDTVQAISQQLIEFRRGLERGSDRHDHSKIRLSPVKNRARHPAFVPMHLTLAPAEKTVTGWSGRLAKLGDRSLHHGGQIIDNSTADWTVSHHRRTWPGRDGHRISRGGPADRTRCGHQNADSGHA